MTFPCINPKDAPYNAVGDGTTDDFPAIKAAIADAMSTGLELRLPPGDFRLHFTHTEFLDFTACATKGLRIVGSGIGRSRFILTTSMTSGSLWEWGATADWYDLALEGFSFISSFEGAMHKLGKDNLSDPLNVFTAKNVAWLNAKAGGSTAMEALRLNFVVNSHLDSCRVNCFANGAGANYGVALRIQQGQFIKHTNYSYGNAAYGVLFSGGWSNVNSFDTGDSENTSYCFYNASPNSGSHTIMTSRISLWQAYAACAPMGADGAPVFGFARNSLGPLAGHTTFIAPGSESRISFSA